MVKVKITFDEGLLPKLPDQVKSWKQIKIIEEKNGTIDRKSTYTKEKKNGCLVVS